MKKPRVSVNQIIIAKEYNLFNLFESANKIIQMVAWWLKNGTNRRFRNPNDRVWTPLIAQEIAESKRYLIYLAQQDD